MKLLRKQKLIVFIKNKIVSNNIKEMKNDESKKLVKSSIEKDGRIIE